MLFHQFEPGETLRTAHKSNLIPLKVSVKELQERNASTTSVFSTELPACWSVSIGHRRKALVSDLERLSIEPEIDVTLFHHFGCDSAVPTDEPLGEVFHAKD